MSGDTTQTHDNVARAQSRASSVLSTSAASLRRTSSLTPMISDQGPRGRA